MLITLLMARRYADAMLMLMMLIFDYADTL